MEQMEKNLMEKFEKQEQQLDEIYKTVKRLKRYFLTTIIISVLTFLLPILAVILSLPWLMKTFETLTMGSLL
jgi:lipopolysaccharide/colanic/teichoic acid biosynthesis glycosyltransferase